MNQIYPYEQQMKETLRDLPAGDVERDWESMRKLLDEEGKKRRGVWIPNWQKAALLCLFAGLLGLAIGWLQLTNRHQAAELYPKTTTNASVAEKIEKPIDQSAEISASSSNQVAAKSSNIRQENKSISPLQNISSIDNRYPIQSQPKAHQSKEAGNQTWTAVLDENRFSNSGQPEGNKAGNRQPHRQSSWVDAPQKDMEALKPSIPDFQPTRDAFLASNLRFNQREKIYGTGNQFLPGYKIPVVVEGKKERRELKKSFRSINTNSVGNNVSFAAGLLIPTNISVAQQQRPGLNINAANNLITDYIPAAFLQYHITPKLFVHSEFQFQSPQLTNRLLMSQSDLSTGPNSSIQNRVFVEKLYYFNLPISVHYSPLRNFYVGTGMQYSSLISGVAGYETQRLENGVSTNSNYQARRFQDDSLSSALKSSDVRWQMDANYYLNRFTFGARYNRALNNLVDIQVGNTRTQARNQNMQIYIRYNLWEEKRPR